MPPPPIRGIVETALYADDLAARVAFFRDVMALPISFEGPRLVAFACGTAQNLLIFDRAESATDLDLGGGAIPDHHGDGPAHMAFHVSLADYPVWRDHFVAAGVAILSEVTFAAGGKSLYFNDPAGNVLELATPGIWVNF